LSDGPFQTSERRVFRTGTSSARRCTSKCRKTTLQPAARGVAQQLAALAEGHLHQLQQGHVQCRRQWVRHHAHHGAVHARGGSKLSGGTNSTFSMA
jgi:hypothetical protein